MDAYRIEARTPDPPVGPRVAWYQHEARLRRVERATVWISIAFCAAFALLALGCSGVTSIRARDGSMTEDMTELTDEILEACEILGLICEPTSRGYGAITLDLVEVGDHDRVRGRTLDRACRPSIWVEADPLRIAHEIGHVLEANIGNEDEAGHMAPGNLLDKTASTDFLTHEQREIITESSMLLDGCRP